MGNTNLLIYMYDITEKDEVVPDYFYSKWQVLGDTAQRYDVYEERMYIMG